MLFSVYSWRIDENLPGIYANERILQESVSNVIDNALKYVILASNMKEIDEEDPVVLLQIRPSNEGEKRT